ncbi:MAG: hypothetical protein KIT18_05055 [Burkholderiales bacterium]|nr:hypothetical protein [Burkholderiales bacterium]
MEITAPENEARNLGTITAEAGRIGIHRPDPPPAASPNASSAGLEGGRIPLKAKRMTDAGAVDQRHRRQRPGRGGEIIAFADNNMYVDGVLKGLLAPEVSGDGGFIETSGKNRVKVADSVAISTSAVNGRTGTWLIDPNDFVIDAMAVT